MKKGTWIIAALMVVFAGGCATTVDINVRRPPTFNTLGIQRLAVMPFTTADGSSLQRQAATWLTNESQSRIQATGHFTLINPSEVERVRSARGNVEDLADALFSGQVISIGIDNSSQQNSYKDKDGNTIYYTTYFREVQLSFNYNLTRTRDGTMLGPLSRTVKTNASSQDSSSLQSAESMLQGLVQRSMAGVGRDVAPYTVTERRRFEPETSKDKVIKQRAKDADALVKSGSYKTAQEAYLRIYQDTGSFAAGYNAGLLIELQGDLEGAATFMQRVFDETGNPRAVAEVARLRKAMDNAGLLEAYRENQSQRDKVIAYVVDTLPSVMPSNPRVALINNSQHEKDLMEVVINGIIDGFISKNITVVDRNSRALVEMERNYQLSGNVSDDEMVRIGHEAGVNTFILLSITGSGGSRRLSVRVLDVERSTVLYQSPQTDAMNL